MSWLSDRQKLKWDIDRVSETSGFEIKPNRILIAHENTEAKITHATLLARVCARPCLF